MSEAQPSFISLYKRGKYHHAPAMVLETQNGDQKTMEEKERFTVAALGFCLRYDLDFRRQFFKQICATECPSECAITVEPESWADLRIQCPGNSLPSIYVIECKIGAALNPIQDPTKPEFIADGGYGWQIQQQYPPDKASVTYVVFGRPERLPIKSPISGITVLQRFWFHLRQSLPNTPLSNDFAELLGRFGIAEFAMNTVKNIRVNAGIQDAAKALNVVNAVCRTMGIRASYFSLTSDASSDGAYFGAEILQPPEKKSPSECHKALQVATGSTSWRLAWFGYEQNGNGAKRTVWFYSDDKQRAGAIADFVVRQFPASSRIPGTVEDGGKHCAGVTGDPSAMGDGDWFIQVLRKGSEFKL